MMSKVMNDISSESAYSSDWFQDQIVENVHGCKDSGNVKIKDEIFVEIMMDFGKERWTGKVRSEDLGRPVMSMSRV